MMGLRDNRKLLPLDEREKKYVASKKYKVVFYNELGPFYVFDISKIMLGPSKYIDYHGDELDEIEDLFVNGDGYSLILDPFFDFLRAEELFCADKEMYDLAFNLKNIRENIELYRNYEDNLE